MKARYDQLVAERERLLELGADPDALVVPEPPRRAGRAEGFAVIDESGPWPDPLRPEETDDDSTPRMIVMGTARGELRELGLGYAFVLAAFGALVGVALIILALLWFSAPSPSPHPTASPALMASVPGDLSRDGASDEDSSGAPRYADAAGAAPGGASGAAAFMAAAAPLRAQGAASSVSYGKASWCAPKGKYCRGWGGKSVLAAVPGYEGPPYWAKVCRTDRKGVCAVVRVHSVCACGTGKVVDLTVYVFRDLLGGRLHADGVLPVVVTRANLRLPATDTDPVEEGDTTR